jgi:hypothetical protein
MKRPFPKLTTLRLAIAAALCGLSGSVLALGFGRLNTSAVLGQTLNLAIPVRLEVGEDLVAGCAAADVYFGDTKQMPDLVQVRIEGQPGIASERILRVLTTARVNEPVVTIYLVAGCQSKVTRKFVAFADPPSVAEPTVALATLEAPVGAPVAAPSGARVEPRSASSPADLADGESGSAIGSTAHANPGKQGARRHASKGATPSQRPVRPEATARDADAAASTQAMAAMPSRSAQAPVVVAGLDTHGKQISRRDKHRTGKLARNAVHAKDTEVSRLVLDPIEIDTLVTPELRLSSELARVEDDAGAAGQAVRERREAAAALWRALNATPEQLAHDRQRLQELEARLTQVQAENRVARDQMKALEAQIKLAQSERVSGSLVYGFAGLSVALAVVLGGLLVRQRRATRADWWGPQVDEPRASTIESTRHALEPSGTGLSTAPIPTATLLKSAPPAPAAPVEPPAAQSPAVVAASPSAPLTPAKPVLREVSVEELIDLEQQAEFFMVLGQDDAAIDLLQGHIDSTEGSSPLPYLKLLEIYQRTGDREAYERIREQFNAQFNAYAPAWEADLQQGHVLADYVGVVERLQALWDAPDRAMEVLQATLLRRDPDADTFDLPAYRELLFLYSVARDLAEHRGQTVPAALSTQPVDLLLPIADAQEPAQPLLATRPDQAVSVTRPAPLAVDVTLDDVVEPESPAPAARSGNVGPIDFEHVDISRKV